MVNGPGEDGARRTKLSHGMPLPGRMRMRPCRHRLVPERESYCWLGTNRLVGEGEAALVFHGSSETRPIMCDAELADACPWREWDGDAVRLPTVPCPCCGRRHRAGSNSQRLCEEWHSAKEVLKRMRQELPEGSRYYPEGTTQLPYSDDTPDLIRRLIWTKLKTAVLRRDRYRCQDCGEDFKARRRKVYDASLRRGRGGYRWESLEVHHIIARSSGGSDHPGNLKTLCPRCHREYTAEQAVKRTAEGRIRREELCRLAEAGYSDDAVDDPRD
ncbi:HNH endonuclease [Methanomassiliicoccus luminyensis]|uniref:HNH endonuclease n=2 Tax=Methanomassiliicoccus luminyensis TaxID=1080712 RepID=UPI00164D195E|nr:HNH endonuclease [Methanomassiliicoccus luminyensis]